MPALNAYLEAHPEVMTLPVEVRPAQTTTGWLDHEGCMFRVSPDGTVTRWEPHHA